MGSRWLIRVLSGEIFAVKKLFPAPLHSSVENLAAFAIGLGDHFHILLEGRQFFNSALPAKASQAKVPQRFR